MNDNINALIDLHSPDWAALLRSQFAWGIPVVLALAALLLLRPWYLRRRAERRIRSSISRLGKVAINDVSLDNGLEGFVFIDHLVLTPKEILVVTLMQMRGIIFGGEKIDNWSQVLGRRTFKFPNPVAASQERVLAVSYQVPDVPVRGIVLFDDDCSFPKGQPEGAMRAQEILTTTEEWQQATIPATLQSAWDKLAALAQKGSDLYGREVALLRGGQSHTREITAIILIMLALSWSGWRLLAG